jgi:hypothetical protein
MSQAKDLNSTSRRALLAGAPVAAAASLAGGTVANAAGIGASKAGDVDPIFALIEKHKVACDAARTIGDVLSDLHSDDPTENAARERFNKANDGERKVLVALLTCQPTTMAGIIAVLEHVGRVNWVWGEDDDETFLTGAYESNIVEAQMFPAHLAASLRNIVARGQA